MLESRRLILQVLIISGLGLLVGWAFSHYARASDNAIGDGKYEFDSPLETSLPVQARMAETDRLALIIGVSKFSQPSAYLGVLQRKFEHQGLKVLVVFSPESPKSHTLLADAIGV